MINYKETKRNEKKGTTQGKIKADWRKKRNAKRVNG